MIDMLRGADILERMGAEYFAPIESLPDLPGADQRFPGVVNCVPLSVSTVWIS